MSDKNPGTPDKPGTPDNPATPDSADSTADRADEVASEVAVSGEADAVALADEAAAVVESVPDAKSAPDDRAMEGPFDADEANPARPYVDLGGLKILPREGLHLRLEVEEGTNRVVAVGLDYAGSTLQVQAFAAPRSTGLWHEIRSQIEDQILKQGGTSTLREGVFGPELVGDVPVTAPDGTAGTRLARFVGVDGPRWFLRGVIAGDALTNPASELAMEELFRSVVVVRGSQPMPPRDLIPLNMPKTAASQNPAGNA